MNKTTLKRFASWAREELLHRVNLKMQEYGVFATHTIDPDGEVLEKRVLSPVEILGRRALVKEISRLELLHNSREKAIATLLEDVAYTWFNRFIALRFMEVNGYLPSKVRVFSNTKNTFQPQILVEAFHMDETWIDREKLFSYKGQNDREGLYRWLLVAQCNALFAPLPHMFSPLNAYTVLLMPDCLLDNQSVIGEMVRAIPLEDWETVEIIGWLFQYYNDQKKDSIIHSLGGKAIQKEDIPAATQVFTTDWVVSYMVDNSLGRYWLERNPTSPLREKLTYFVPSSSDETTLPPIAPEDLTFFDPCMGSGHMLTYAFDVLMEIYVECGYSTPNAVESILTHNLFGVDIDKRTHQLAYFSLMMKARGKDEDFFKKKIVPKVYAPFDDETLEHFGSLYLPNKEELLANPPTKTNSSAFNNWQWMQLLTRKYVVVCTNPPYLNKYNQTLKAFLTTHYKKYLKDLFSVFMIRNFDFCQEGGYSAFMTPNVWMFLQSYEALRKKILQEKSVVSLVQLAKGSFYSEATVDVCAFIFQNSPNRQKGVYIRLENGKPDMDAQREMLLEGLSTPHCPYMYETDKAQFAKVPGMLLAYWFNEKLLDVFRHPKLQDAVLFRQGMATSDNNRFVRLWHEVARADISFHEHSLLSAKESQKKWFPFNKGGKRRKWYGNQTHVVNWFNDGEEMKGYTSTLSQGMNVRLKSREYYFKPCFSWSKISGSQVSFRYYPQGFAFDVAGCCAFDYGEFLHYYLGLCNSSVTNAILQLLSPTLNSELEHLKKLPLLVDLGQKARIDQLVQTCISLSKDDWDAFETAWTFTKHPLCPSNGTDSKKKDALIRTAFERWAEICENRFATLKACEEELNAIFISIYSLEGEVSPTVEDKDISLRKADYVRDVKGFISYVVGCMFGRFTHEKIQVVKDNILLLYKEEGNGKDITTRFTHALKEMYGKSTLQENLRFIADALDTNGTAVEKIRHYFTHEFAREHHKMYDQRPMYWQLQSGKKNAFQALIYIHRYHPSSLAHLRTKYLRPLQTQLQLEITEREQTLSQAEATARQKIRKQLQLMRQKASELQHYEEKVHHLSQEMPLLPLDDGILTNYKKLQEILLKV